MGKIVQEIRHGKTRVSEIVQREVMGKKIRGSKESSNQVNQFIKTD